MRVWDASGSGSIVFDAGEADASSLGHIVENREILQALLQCAQALPCIELCWGHALETMSSAGSGWLATCSTGREFHTALAIGADGLHVRFFDKHGEAELHSSLWGRFNVENLLVAAGILMVSGVTLNDAISVLAKCDAPAGRMELLGGEASQPLVIVDFAHTPDALDKALTTVRDHCTGAIWCVFGCGGDRDQGKRFEMAEVVSRCADFAIVTDDNPRHENPEKIVADILQGFSADARAEVVHDRAAAIGKAVASAAHGDVVFIAGKGAESYQLQGDLAHPFSDRDVASRALEEAA